MKLVLKRKNQQVSVMKVCVFHTVRISKYAGKIGMLVSRNKCFPDTYVVNTFLQ